MNNKLFVGSLPWAVDDQKLNDMFQSFGEIVSANIVRDRETKKSRGFGFVEYTTEEAAQAALDAMNGKDIEGRTISVSIARPRE